MSSEVKIRSASFMESQNDNESLRARIREVEDENQELRAQNLLQNRTVMELRNEVVLLRLQMNELSDTSSLLRERIRALTQNAHSNQQQENARGVGPITAPPLMAPPPVPPPLPPARIRISPRQVGAGEALTTPLGVSLSSPPRHRIKRDFRQGYYRGNRVPYRRLDVTEPGPSSQTQSPYYSPERPNYFFGLKIIPQFQTSIVCSPGISSGYSDSASDSSGSDENPQLHRKLKPRPSDAESPFKKPPPVSKDFDLFNNVRDLHHHKVRQTILQNYSLSLPATNSKFFFPIPWDSKLREPPPVPSTSGNSFRFFPASNPSTSDRTQPGPNGLKNAAKVSDCVQYTFPTIHEGLNQSGVHTVVTNTGQPSRMRKFKKNIPYLPPGGSKIPDEACAQSAPPEDVLPKGSDHGKPELGNLSLNSESFSSTDESRRGVRVLGEQPSDFDQDGFQADESSNCMTSTDTSLEQICVCESDMKKKN